MHLMWSVITALHAYQQYRAHPPIHIHPPYHSYFRSSRSSILSLSKSCPHLSRELLRTTVPEMPLKTGMGRICVQYCTCMLLDMFLQSCQAELCQCPTSRHIWPLQGGHCHSNQASLVVEGKEYTRGTCEILKQRDERIGKHYISLSFR